MKRLQGKQWQGGPREGAALCDICGGRYRMGQLVTNADGFLVCSGPGTNNDADGLTRTEAARLEAGHAAELGNHEHLGACGSYDHGADS